jgi:hypothetical protein
MSEEIRNHDYPSETEGWIEVIPIGGPYRDEPYKTKCPHCHIELTLKEAITILNGDGFGKKVRVKTPDGTVYLMDAGQVDPTACEILEW